MRGLSTAVVLLLALVFSVAATAADGALVLGLELRDGGVTQVSASTLERVPTARPVSGETWTLRVVDAEGTVAFERAVAPPRQHHRDADAALAFAVVVPRAPTGSHVVLTDANGVERWSIRIDAALLSNADATSRRLASTTQQAQAKTVGAEQPRAGSALARQLAAARAQADRRALEQRNVAPVAPRAAREPAKRAGGVAAPHGPVLPLQMEPQAKSQASPSAAKVAVAVRIVKDDGTAPGVAIQAWLLDAGGNLLAPVQVPATGQTTIDIPGNGNYILDIRPPPPLLSRRAAFAYSGAALADFVIGSGWLYEVVVQDAATGTPLTTAPAAWLYPQSGDAIAGYVAAGRARFAVPKNATMPYTAYIYGFATHPGIVETLAPFTADRSATISVPATAALPLQVRGPTAAAQAQVQCEANGPTATRHYFGVVNTNASGAAALPLPRDMRYTCYVSASAPLLSQWFGGVAPPATGAMVFDLQRAATLRVNLRDEAGAPFAGDFVGSWVDYTLGVSYSCDTNPCVLTVPSATPVTVTFDFADERNRDTSIGPETFATDTERILTVARLHRVSGSVQNPLDDSIETQVVARHADGRFAASLRTDETGLYTFDLPSGTYTLSAYAMPNALVSVGVGNHAYQAPAASGPLTLAGDLQPAALVLPDGAGTLALKARLPCRPLGDGFVTVGYRGVLHLAGPDGRHIERMWRMNGAPASIAGSDECHFNFATNLSPGAYAVAVTLPGWPERALGTVTVTDGGQHALEASFALADRDELWQPQVRYADGTPAAGVTALLYDETQRGMMQFQSDAAGRLALPQVPGWGAELYLPDTAPGTSVRRSFLFGDTPPPATVTFAQVASGTTQDGTAQRVFGNGERDSRYNILFVAEGYTDEHETFEDRNGNGVWDGVLWVDVNGNDVYDAGTDWYTTYGNAAVPSGNTVPGADNEPFTDLNGDGALSLDDRALFLENSHVFLRSLLGSDYWSEHRDMFNAYALFAPSPQAGYDVIDEDQTTILRARDTLYGAGVELDRFTIALDRSAAIQQALHALPDVDIVVVLVNQPVSAGRANVSFGGSGPGVMVYYGGVQETSPNGIVQSHEMGHFVGALCDEYDEFLGQHPQSGSAGPGCANSSYRHERAHLPWGNLVAADASLPTLDIDGSTTAVIGSSYYNDGAYRPTFNSTMRSNSPFFNEPSRRALAANTCIRTQGDLGCGAVVDDELRTATWWDPAESGWGLFTIDQGNILAPGWFTYDLDGEPTWFLVPGALPQADGSYRGDILRYTGVPFPQIAGNAADPGTRVGDARLVFDGRNRLDFTYTVGNTTRTRALSRFVYGDRDIVCRAATAPLEQATQYSDLWWSPNASGWGLFIAHVGDTLFATWYTYDADREAVFMVGAATRQADGSYAGTLVRQRNGTPYPQIDGAPASPGSDPVGTVELRFDNGNAGTFRYTIGGASGTHAITRLRFGETAGVCTADAVEAARSR